MSDPIESFDQAKNEARVAAGFKGGPFFNSPNLSPTMTFVEGHPPEVLAKLDAQSFPQPMPADPWVTRSGK